MENFLREYFTTNDMLNKFNNSEILSMKFRYTRKKCFIPVLGEPIFFPYKATDMEIVNVLRDMISVPFNVSIGREPDNSDLIYGIGIGRVFIPDNA